MGKIYPVSTKYTITADIKVDGAINKNDIVGAIFGQTEGLLGDDLELRDLQKGGRVGRIEVKVKTKNGKTTGTIVVPSSLAKAETAIIAASLETIERIGPCSSKIKIRGIDDVRLNKREKIMDRAKKLLKKLNIDSTESSEIMDNVKESVRISDIIQYGPDKLAASDDIEDVDEVILVEGRADVVNLVKHKLKGILSINGVKVPKSIKKILDSKKCTLFVDGDRGGDLIVNKVMRLGDLNFVAVAPDGKEVEELTSKEIFKCLRLKKPADEYKTRGSRSRRGRRSSNKSKKTSSKAKNKYADLISDLFGTRGAYLIDKDLNIIGKVPSKELINTLHDSSNVDTVILDGVVDKELVKVAEDKKVNTIVSNNVKTNSRKVKIIKF